MGHTAIRTVFLDFDETLTTVDSLGGLDKADIKNAFGCERRRSHVQAPRAAAVLDVPGSCKIASGLGNSRLDPWECERDLRT